MMEKAVVLFLSLMVALASTVEPTVQHEVEQTIGVYLEQTQKSITQPTAEDEKPVINYEYALYKTCYFTDDKVEIENPTGEYVNGIFVLDGMGEKFNCIMFFNCNNNWYDIVQAYIAKYPELSLNYGGLFDDDCDGDGEYDFNLHLCIIEDYE